jgi:hypothetical protein
MSAVKTLQIRIVNPKAERVIDDLASQNLIEIDESETSSEETPLDRYRQWCCKVNERERRDGTCDIEPPTMEEIVAICKEARAEMYEKQQKVANNR